MKHLTIIAAVLLLAGCQSLNTLQGGIADRGAAVSDEMRESAEFVICRGITVGAWTRAYGQSQERAQAWRALCSSRVEQTPKE